MEAVKKVSPLKGRKLGPRKKPSPLKGRKLGPSPLKGRKLGPRKPKKEGITRAQLATELEPGLNALFGLEFKELRETQKPLAVPTLLQERALQYGTFAGLAKTAQEFKSVLYRELGSRNKRLADDQAEALDMILTKIARVVNGNADVVDHWEDIAGYAKLVSERLQGRSL